MDTLDALIDRGLINPDLTPIKPLKAIRVLSNGVIFQMLCHNGLPYDIAISWLQKAIRRGYQDQAMYCAYHIYQLGKPYRSHLLNRLIIIASEDIGPAEPGLIQVVKDYYLICRDYNNANEIDKMQPIIIEIIDLLCRARKSRITDWLMHYDEIDPTDSLPFTIQLARSLKDGHEPANVNISIREKDGSVTHYYKKLMIYEIWVSLLEYAEQYNYYNDVVSLFHLFNIRGTEYGMLFLAHACCLCYLDLPEQRTLKSDQLLPKWESLTNLSFPILNCAVDTHTKWGKKYLGRSSLDFLFYGSKLLNWTPFPREIELQQYFLDHYCTKPIIDNCQARYYQQDIVNKAIQHYKVRDQGWLIMACGTGKTKTSYWIHKEIHIKPKLTVVVVPYLEILKQFFQVWSSMMYTDKSKYHVGIVASCRKDFVMTAYNTYEYLITLKNYDDFLKVKTPKIIMVTYTGFKKLKTWNVEPDMVIYDEAHHATSKYLNISGIKLFLTATPKFIPSSELVIDVYHLEKAIADNYLTDYKINILPEQLDEASYLDSVLDNGSKIIVYASTVKRALALMEICSFSNFKVFSITATTLQADRDNIFKQFNNSERVVLFNCATLGEGVDLPCCDTIYIHSGYNSKSRVVQAFGRPLRKYDGKTQANIFIHSKKANVKINHIMFYDSNVENKVVWLENV